MSFFPGEDIFTPLSPAMAPEDVIPKVEPRLQGFKLKEIFLKHVQINEIERKPSWYEIKAIKKKSYNYHCTMLVYYESYIRITEL